MVFVLQTGGNLVERDIGLVFDQTQNIALVTVKLRTARLPLLACFHLSEITIAAIPATRRRHADIKARAAALRVDRPSQIAAITRMRRSAL